jgi:hypothetical protein
MFRLAKALAAWGTPAFESTLKSELEQVAAEQLPLQQGLSWTSHVTGSQHSVMFIAAMGEDDVIRARVGVFYGGALIGCSCADDPTPVEEQPEYCTLQLDIDRKTAETRAVLLSE